MQQNNIGIKRMKVKNIIEKEEKDSFICEDLDDLIDSDKD